MNHRINHGAALDSLQELEQDGDTPVRVLAVAREAVQRALAGLIPLPEHQQVLMAYAARRATQNRYGQ
jgi:hypothetical protein